MPCTEVRAGERAKHDEEEQRESEKMKKYEKYQKCLSGRKVSTQTVMGSGGVPILHQMPGTGLGRAGQGMGSNRFTAL